MNSRKMERAERSLGGGDATRTLRSLLEMPGKGRPERLLALRWDLEPGTGVAASVVAASNLDTAGTQPYDAVVWASPDAVPSPEALGRLRQLLSDGGRLVLAAASNNGLSGVAVGRTLIRELSETGFVVLQELDPEDVGTCADAVVLARRDDFTIRPWRDGDGEPIRRLFNESFHVDRGLDHWCWKYHENPYGNRYLSLAVAPDGELAAHYAGFPIPFWCDGEASTGLQMGDTMTHPRFRKVGRGVSSLLARTVRHFFSIHRRGPFDFFYGFNTGGIQRFCRWFIGGSQVEPVSYRRREKGAVEGSLRGYRVERVTRIDQAWDRFFKRVAPHYGFLVRRDAEYADWRYLRCPDGEPYVVLAAYRFRRLVGWGVFRRKEDRVVWGDALFDPRHVGAAESILARALEELEGASCVEGWFPDRPSWWDAELDRLGFAKQREPNRLGFMILPDGDEDPPLERLYYTMGDGDLF